MIAAMRCPIKAANQLSRDGKQATALQGHCLQTHRDRLILDWISGTPGRARAARRGHSWGSACWTSGPGSPLCHLFISDRAARFMLLSPEHLAHCQCSVNAWRIDMWMTAKWSVNQWYSTGETQSWVGQFWSCLLPQSIKPHYGVRQLPPWHF